MGSVTRIDHEESREWLQGRFMAMTSELVMTWDIAQDIVTNWSEGRRVSQLPECQGKFPGEVFREWVEALQNKGGAGAPILDRDDRKVLGRQLKAARIKNVTPPEYQAKIGRSWSLYAELPAGATKAEVASIFKKADAQPIGISKRGLRLVQQKATGMKQPYWQQVIDDLMTGEKGLTKATARNIIATAQRWLEEQT